MAREKIIEPANTNAWMATFADLLSLMITFFVLLFAMKSVDSGKLEETLGYFRQGGIGILRSGTHLPMSSPQVDTFDPRAIKQYSPSEVSKMFDSPRLDAMMIVRSESRGVVLSVESGILFTPGGAELKPAAQDMLREIALISQGAAFKIQVQGHTDNVPLRSVLYPTNWELSVARAGSIVRYMIGTGKVEAERFSVVGYGDSRPLVPNDSVANRAKNRRVELILLK